MTRRVDFWDVVRVSDVVGEPGSTGYVAGIGAYGPDDPDRSVFVIFYGNDATGIFAESALVPLGYSDEIARAGRDRQRRDGAVLTVRVDSDTGAWTVSD